MRNGVPDPLGCAPVLDLWTSMENWDTQVRGEELQRFFYEGRGNVGAVLTHGNYAMGGGQIRTNGIGFGNSTGGWVLNSEPILCVASIELHTRTISSSNGYRQRNAAV